MVIITKKNGQKYLKRKQIDFGIFRNEMIKPINETPFLGNSLHKTFFN